MGLLFWGLIAQLKRVSWIGKTGSESRGPPNILLVLMKNDVEIYMLGNKSFEILPSQRSHEVHLEAI